MPTETANKLSENTEVQTLNKQTESGPESTQKESKTVSFDPAVEAKLLKKRDHKTLDSNRIMHNVKVLDSALDRRRKAKKALKVAEKEYKQAQTYVLQLKEQTLNMFLDSDSNENSYTSKKSDESREKS